MRHIVIKLTKIKDENNIVKATKWKRQIAHKGPPIRLSADFSTETQKLGKGKAGYSVSDEREEPTTKSALGNKTLPQIWWRNQKLSWQAKGNRVQHHQTTLTTNAKGTSPGRKHREEKYLPKNKPKTIKEMVTGSNTPIKRQRPAGQMKTCTCVHFYLPRHSAWLPNCM